MFLAAAIFFAVGAPVCVPACEVSPFLTTFAMRHMQVPNGSSPSSPPPPLSPSPPPSSCHPRSGEMPRGPLGPDQPHAACPLFPLPPSPCPRPPVTHVGGKRHADPPVLTSHTLEALHDCISDFFHHMPKSKCANCTAWNPNIKKQGHTKLFMVSGGGPSCGV